MKIAAACMVVALALSACSQVDSVSSEEAPLVAARDPGAITDMVCASQDQFWSDYPETEIAYYVCTYPTGTCAPVYVTVLESVECENSCSNPTKFVCYAYPPAPYSIHQVSYPSRHPDSTCQIPCNSRSLCDTCT